MTKFKIIRSVLRTMQKTEWKIDCYSIRTKDTAEKCPLAFVASQATGRSYTTSEYKAAACVLNIDHDTRDLIATAADEAEHTWLTPDLRKRDWHNRMRRVMEKAVKQ